VYSVTLIGANKSPITERYGKAHPDYWVQK
jgi:hypothetical protein